MSASRSSRDPEFRYNKILKPENDINKNFSINITDILQSYLDELSSINPGIAINFAEAALLIQGSTSIYSKKVELLHGLASDLMFQLRNEKKKCAEKGTKKKESNHSERNAAEFESLDDIVPAKNINLNEDALQNGPGVPRVPLTPLCLIPLDSIEKGNVMLKNSKGEDLGNKMDYQLNICSIHSSGCLLLPSIQYDFSKAAEEMLDPLTPDDDVSDDHDMEDDNDSSPGDLSPPDGDDISNELTSSNNLPIETGLNLKEITGDFPSLPDGNEPVATRRSIRQATKLQKEKEEAETKRKEKEKREEAESQNAWTVIQEQPPEFKKQIQKKNIRKMPRKLLRKLSGQPPEEEDSKEQSVLSFCSKNFFGAETEGVKKFGLFSNKLAINAAFEQLVVGCLKEQQANLKMSRKKLKLDKEVGQETEEAMEDFANDADNLPEANNDDDDDDANEDNNNDNNIDNLPPSDDMDIPTIEDLAIMPDVCKSYESKAKEMLDSYMREVAQFSLTTELTEKVSKWEERIKPILESENEREGFNIHLYGTRIIDNFKDNNKKQSINFNEVCTGKSAWEVSRYFLSSLQLANNRNVEIETVKRENGLDDVTFTLLSRKRHHEELDKFGHSQGEH